MNKNLILKIAVVTLIGGLLGGYISGLVDNNQSGTLGGSTSDDWNVGGNLAVTGTSAFGSSGTAVAKINTGTCYIKAYATTIAATSTATVDCQATAAVDVSGISSLSGITAGDVVSVNLATSTAGTTSGGLALIGASASSTSGYITLRLSNLTGTTYTWPTTGTATGTATYIVTDIQSFLRFLYMGKRNEGLKPQIIKLIINQVK